MSDAPDRHLKYATVKIHIAIGPNAERASARPPLAVLAANKTG